MRVCLLITGMVIAVIQLRVPARAQTGTDISPAIQVHPDVPTILQFPDEIEGVWSIGGGEIREVRVKGVGRKLYLRPRPGTPAGFEVFIEVKTRTVHRLFLVRVVERAEGARREVVVHAADATPSGGAPAPASPQEVPRDVLPVVPEPAANVPGSQPAPTSAGPAAPIDERAAEAATIVAAGSRRFELSGHAVVALGTTALGLTGHEPLAGLQSHYAFGVRLAGAPRGAWWALEVEISSESLAGSLSYFAADSSRLEVSGPWRRAILGMRAQFGTRWVPSAYAGIGAHAHLREIQGSDGTNARQSATMEFGGVLALGTGLQYRTRGVLLGLDVQVRLGEPDGYRAVTAFVSVGRVLDQGE